MKKNAAGSTLFYPTEAKLQGGRALGIFTDHAERLPYQDECRRSQEAGFDRHPVKPIDPEIF